MAMLSLSSPLVPPLNSLSISSPIQPHSYFIHGNLLNLPFKSLTSPPKCQLQPNSSSPTNTTTNQQQEQEQQEQEEDYVVLTALRSEFNNIVILESQKTKVLLLDDSGNVHSIMYKGKKWTNSYWDEFSSLPAIIPKGGPVAIFGLGGGTVAHQLLDVWPDLIVEGWELDNILVDQARQFFGLSELEKGNLTICVGDALASSASVEGGYAGIVVDLFSDAKVLPQLEKAETWVAMREKLMPNGRIMVNCGGAKANANANVNANGSSGWKVNSVIEAMCVALRVPDVCWKKMPQNESGNYLAFTGPMPDLDVWSELVPEKLSSSVKLWRPCE